MISLSALDPWFLLLQWKFAHNAQKARVVAGDIIFFQFLPRVQVKCIDKPLYTADSPWPYSHAGLMHVACAF